MGYLVQLDGSAAEVRFATLHSIAAPSLMGVKFPLEDGEFFDEKYHQKHREYYLEKANKHKLVKAFSSGLDVHTAGTAIVMGKDPKDITKEERTDGKTVTLGRMYKREYKSIADQYGVDPDVMYQRIKKWDNTFPELSKEWHPAVEDWVTHYGFVVSLFGLIRRLPDVWSAEKWIRAKNMREAVNSPVQGDSHIWISKSITWFQRNIIDRGYTDKALIINDIHDAWIIDTPSKELDKVVIGMVCAMLHFYWEKDLYPWMVCDLACDLEIYNPWGNTRGRLQFDTSRMTNKNDSDFNLTKAVAEVWFKNKETFDL